MINLKQTYDTHKFIDDLKEFNISLSEHQINQFLKYFICTNRSFTVKITPTARISETVNGPHTASLKTVKNPTKTPPFLLTFYTPYIIMNLYKKYYIEG